MPECGVCCATRYTSYSIITIIIVFFSAAFDTRIYFLYSHVGNI